MAFDPENKKITDAVKQIPSAPVNNKKNTSTNDLFTIPKMKKEEKTKNYTFTMKPKIRKKLSALSKSHGFKSDSAFLSYMIEHVE